MRKLILLLLLLSCAACQREDKHVEIFMGDIMFFAEIPVITNEEAGAVEAITTKSIDTKTTRSWEWQVWRSIAVATDYYPRQYATVVIDKTRSTAIEGVDFRLEGADVVFEHEKVWYKNIKLDILPEKLTEPKTLVLKLDYGYEDLRLLSERNKNRLTITLQ